MNETRFTIEPWCVREEGLHLDALAQSESIFALGNGHIGLRGNLDEGEPHGLPGTYLNSVYETRPLPYAEAGFGYPEAGQTIINVTNGKLLRLLVDDEPFDVRYGSVAAHERVLDLRAGTLGRHVEWISPAETRVIVDSTRLVSLTQRSIAAICYELCAPDAPLRVVVQSELVANESLPGIAADPRVAAVLESPLESESVTTVEEGAVMVHRTKGSGFRVGAGMFHIIEGPDEMSVESEGGGDVARVTVAARLGKGDRLRIVKLLGYGWSVQRSRPAVHDQVVAALAAARMSGWSGLLEEQRSLLADFWAGADVELQGDTELQQAVRFALFQILQSAIRAEGRPIPAKGLTGPGYDGHAFWDAETFVLPVLDHTRPDAAADALRWRHATLPTAVQRAAQLGLAGAAFPWRTIGGEECSSYWPAGTAAFHVNADIAAAVLRHVEVTGDESFARDVGLGLLVQTARLWRSLGHHDAAGHFRIDGVTGPDEYSALADNNVYTNLQAAKNLRGAAEIVARHPDRAAALGASLEEAAAWRNAAAAMFIPFDERLGVHPQSSAFTDHDEWDFANTPPEHYPLLLHVPYFDLYRKQVVKQADLVLAMQLCPQAFTPEQKLRNFDYYEAITVRDSSLSAGPQAVIAAEVGHLDLAHDYLGETALIDLRDLEHNTADGLHLAALAATWTAIVAGFGGLRIIDGALTFAPRLPGAIARLRFRLQFRGRRLTIGVEHDAAHYELAGEPLTVWHHGESFELGAAAETRPIPPRPPVPPPKQPPGRVPERRSSQPAD